jgi:hypothetical protein
VLILDSSAERAYAGHRAVVETLEAVPHVAVHLLDESAQRVFLDKAVVGAGLGSPNRLIGLMLPDGVSYGACTNRAFLIAAALGCESVHRRDSDSAYQDLDGRVPSSRSIMNCSALGDARAMSRPRAGEPELRSIRRTPIGPW